jgi:hypothetical protein
MEMCDDCRSMEIHMHGAKLHPALRPVGEPAPADTGVGEVAKTVEHHVCTVCGTKWTETHDGRYSFEGWVVGW